MKVTIYTDGSSRGNPGPGGYGAVLQFVDSTGKLHERELSQGYATTTNNRMELLGVIVALEALKRPCTVEVHSDSQYVVNAFTSIGSMAGLSAAGRTRRRSLSKTPTFGGACSRRKSRMT